MIWDLYCSTISSSEFLNFFINLSFYSILFDNYLAFSDCIWLFSLTSCSSLSLSFSKSRSLSLSLYFSLYFLYSFISEAEFLPFLSSSWSFFCDFDALNFNLPGCEALSDSSNQTDCYCDWGCICLISSCSFLNLLSILNCDDDLVLMLRDSIYYIPPFW